MQPKLLAFLIALCLFFLILELIRRQKMTFRYAFFWFNVSFFLLLFTVQDKLLEKLSSLAGFELTSNFVFFLFIAAFGVLCLFLTVYINEQNSRTESLAQAVGILNYELKKLRKETGVPPKTKA